VAVLKQAGYNVDCINMNMINDLKISKNKYDFIATGGMAIHYEEIHKISMEAHRSKTKLIIGGGIVTSEPELISRAINTDYAVLGEGEVTILELLDSLEQNGSLEAVAGIGFLRHDSFITTSKRKPILKLDTLPFPDYEAFGFETYLDHLKPSDVYNYDIFDYPRVYPLISSRSCPFRCTFCYSPLGNRYRQRSIDNIMDELRVMVPKYRINIVDIIDELFSYDKERTYEFCEKFKEFASTIPWEIKWDCQLRVDKLEEEMIDRVKDAGCFMISYGLESYSATVLESMKKHITPDQIYRAVKMTLDKKMSLQGNFIFGDIAETTDTAKETLNYWKENVDAGILLAWVMPYPNSKLYQVCLEKGIIKDKLKYISNQFSEVFNMTTMSDVEFIKLRLEVYKTPLKYNLNTIPSVVGDNFIVVKCPHCDATMEYKNYSVYDQNMYIQFLSPWKWVFYKTVYCRNCRRRFWIMNRAFKIYANLLILLLNYKLFKLYSKLLKYKVFIKKSLTKYNIIKRLLP
jgi:radical SAM superfamily enzyme YgiQ (UPF0313 family)